MGILSTGTRALVASQVALQTTGNNIANVNVQGYSRQNVVLETVEGQFTGGGYIGNGANVQTIQRNFSEFLTRQSALAGSTKAGDVARADKLKQLEGIFEGGTSGLGAAVNDMLNAFSDVASAPTDLTARTVVLTRVDETASRMRATAQRLDDLQLATSQELTQKVSKVNSLAKSIADVNLEITRAIGSGQPPNDLLDRRDQLVRELNQYVQTTSIKADDGSVGIFLAGSQALVLGAEVAPVVIAKDDFGDGLKSKLAITRNGVTVPLDESTLGGGEISGLLRFQNTDLNEGRNLLGRMTLAISTAMNDQHKLGLDLDGNPGTNLFSLAGFNSNNVLQPQQFPPPAPSVTVNQGDASLTLGINDVSKFAASDYEVSFSSATQGSITRRSDGIVTAFDFGATNPVQLDGLDISMPSGTPAAGDRFLLKPFSTSASTITREFSTPRALAVSSPVVASMGKGNTGSMQLVSLKVTGKPGGLTLPPSPVLPATTGAGVQLSFVAGPPVGFTISGTNTPPTGFVGPYVPGTTVVPYIPNSTLSIDGWEVTLTGSPQANDTVQVGNAKDAQYGNYYTRNAGNANDMMGLRDVAMFDGAALTDGYAGLMSQIGIRAQSANYAADVSTSIAGNLEKDRAGVSGVNLDEEAAKLLQFQQSYQASAKMIQIAQNIFDTLIQTLGR
ncbi:MAG: flagellar hook-associated protein FlgK [Burkholderiales bacterium RIFCSPLOWO2_12_FULL_61_40]|nr:MAG: flagellar hook-associated protein FlgK [Burkholderiales bacterium RIFCSPLOWO2_12_FULL_61_40]